MVLYVTDPLRKLIIATTTVRQLNLFRSFQLKEVGVMNSTLYSPPNFPALFCFIDGRRNFIPGLLVLYVLYFAIILMKAKPIKNDEKYPVLINSESNKRRV